MSVTGNLRTMAFGDLLQWLASSGKTGTLVIEGNECTKKVYLRAGAVAAVASDNPRDMLGYYLVGWGFLNEGQLAHAIAMQDEIGAMLGEVVVKLGYLNREDVDYLICVRTEESVFDLMCWEEGSFRFLDDDLPKPSTLEVRIPIDHLLFEGARQRDERARARALVPDARHVPVAVPERLPEAGNDEERDIVAAIDGRRSIEQIALVCRLPEHSVFSFIFRCVESRSLRVDPPSEERDARPGQSHAPWSELVREIRVLLEGERLLDALRLLERLIEKYSSQQEAVMHATLVEAEIQRRLDGGPLQPGTRLAPAVSLRELMRLDCDPAESFVLSRVSPEREVRDVLRELPGPPLQNRVILQNLHRRGLVTIVG